jgi:dihydroorotate dehydrogenase electron transfer subunit
VNLAFARVIQNERLYGETFITWFAAPEISSGAVPGQFVMLRCAESPSFVEAPPKATDLPNDPFLPRPMSIHRVRAGSAGQEWSILYDVVGRGTAWLASRRQGDAVHCWGPLGHGYVVDPTSENLLLVAGGIGVAPLVWLADLAVGASKSAVLVLGARTRDQVFPASMLPPQVEVITTTEDGSLGRKGLATDEFVRHSDWCDQAFACGPNGMFAAMQKALPDRRIASKVQVLLEERMGCGTGICYGCTVHTHKGVRLICKDGPRFKLSDVSF